jgi:hypothetical protein
MEIKFCPQCGTGRQGKFCGGCGFPFDSFHPAASSGGAQSRKEALQRDEITAPTSASELSRPRFPVPLGMAYGESFDQSRHCWNCGVETGPSECELCGFLRP